MLNTKSAFPEFERLHEQIEQMWERLAGGPLGRPRFRAPILEPPTDILETADQVVVVAEIPGIEEHEVEIEIEGDRLLFRGEKSDRQADPNQRHTQIEICYGSFERTLVLPAEVDAEGIEVSYSDGFLRIALPKLKRRRSHQVRVRVRRTGQ
jgi:HSP20 family protein